jgi:hypothetical protein
MLLWERWNPIKIIRMGSRSRVVLAVATFVKNNSQVIPLSLMSKRNKHLTDHGIRTTNIPAMSRYTDFIKPSPIGTYRRGKKEPIMPHGEFDR